MMYYCLNVDLFFLLIQLTLGQHGFELFGSTYMWMFFNSKYCSTTQSMFGLC